MRALLHLGLAWGVVGLVLAALRWASRVPDERTRLSQACAAALVPIYLWAAYAVLCAL